MTVIAVLLNGRYFFTILKCFSMKKRGLSLELGCCVMYNWRVSLASMVAPSSVVGRGLGRFIMDSLSLECITGGTPVVKRELI
jgi:hypothetical protein